MADANMDKALKKALEKSRQESYVRELHAAIGKGELTPMRAQAIMLADNNIASAAMFLRAKHGNADDQRIWLENRVLPDIENPMLKDSNHALLNVAPELNTPLNTLNDQQITAVFVKLATLYESREILQSHIRGFRMHADSATETEQEYTQFEHDLLRLHGVKLQPSKDGQSEEITIVNPNPTPGMVFPAGVRSKITERSSNFI